MKPTKEGDIPRWAFWTSTVLRVLVLLFGVYNFFWGSTVYGLLLLLIFALMYAPSVLTRGKLKRIPIELEIAVMALIFMQYAIGEGGGFYDNVPYFDKFIHTLFPTLIGLVGALIVYSMVVTGNLRINSKAAFILIVLVALGIGAFWELVEYFSDLILGPIIPNYSPLQGSLTEDALSDTLNDLVADTIGAIIGASLGVYLIHRAQKQGSERLDDMSKEFMTMTDEKV